MKRILLSLLVIGTVGGTVFAATNAFFSDTETSTGNTFTAGKVDLTIDSTAHYDGMICTGGLWVDEDQTLANNPRPELIGQICTGTWAIPANLTTEKFFNLSDVKPGDYGENTLSMHIESNPVWACIDIKNLKNMENDLIGPEAAAGDVTPDVINPSPSPSTYGGELAQNLRFTAWSDNGTETSKCDNKWEAGEPLLFTNQQGPASDVLNGKTYALADSTHGSPMSPGDSCIGLQWCAGTMTIDANTHTITCDGASMGNNTQTDSMTADVAFRIEQSRNNPNFSCVLP